MHTPVGRLPKGQIRELVFFDGGYSAGGGGGYEVGQIGGGIASGSLFDLVCLLC